MSVCAGGCVETGFWGCVTLVVESGGVGGLGFVCPCLGCKLSARLVSPVAVGIFGNMT